MLLLGTSGWSYKHWKGRFYPKNLAQNRWLEHYSEFFNTVEVNSSFYRFPRPQTIKDWHKQTPEGFVFTLKVNRNVTHVKKFVNAGAIIHSFYKLGDGLREKMGCFLFQLPAIIEFGRKKLDEIISQLDLERKNVVEFRHASWFKEEVYDKFRENNVIFCSVSAPNLPECLIKTSDDIYIRLHGKGKWYASNYSRKELDERAEKIKKAKARNVWTYFNNDANAYAVRNCLYLKKVLEKKQEILNMQCKILDMLS